MALLGRLVIVIAVFIAGSLVLGGVPAGADGVSRISASDSSGANLRPCPTSQPAQGATDCQGAVDFLPNGSPIEMLCWTEGVKPYGETSSSRWFWVRELEGAPHPDTEAYVWSDLVVNQTETPRCTDEESRYYVRITPPVLGLGQGALAPGGGYRYLVTLNNMGADRDVTITCYDTVSPNGFYTFTMHTDASGYASAGDQCFSGDYGQHWVTADEGLVTSNTVTW